jgi:plastocyanin
VIKKLALGLALLAVPAGAIAPARAAEVEVTITNLIFSPARITVHAGDTIRWINKDFVAHTATALDKSFDVSIPANGQGTLVVKTTGTFDYFCRFHPMMKGSVQAAQ